MGRHLSVVIYVLTLVGVVVGVDVVFFRHHFLARLLANVGVVLVFAAFYLRFQSAFGGRSGRRGVPDRRLWAHNPEANRWLLANSPSCPDNRSLLGS